MRIEIITTGGTIDKVYFDAKNDFQIGEPQVPLMLEEANVTFDYEVRSLLKKDSLELTDADRDLIAAAVKGSKCRHIIITHGTDTMIKTALHLREIAGKVIVLTGAMQPAKLRFTDAFFNIGCAVTAVQLLPEGVYVAMNGRIFDPIRARKNVADNRFEQVE